MVVIGSRFQYFLFSPLNFVVFIFFCGFARSKDNNPNYLSFKVEGAAAYYCYRDPGQTTASGRKASPLLHNRGREGGEDGGPRNWLGSPDHGTAGAGLTCLRLAHSSQAESMSHLGGPGETYRASLRLRTLLAGCQWLLLWDSTAQGIEESRRGVVTVTDPAS